MLKWLAWTLSGVAIIGGIALSATGVGGILGGILIGAGAGSIIADYGKMAASSLLYIANIGKYTNTNVMIASRLVADGIASVTEGIFDVISYLIGLL